MTTTFGRLVTLCTSFGGALLKVDEQRFVGLFDAHGAAKRGRSRYPGTTNGLYGVDWPGRRIYATGTAVQPIIHEMGHVFASLKEPDHADEYEFLGWEIAVARLVGCYRQWSSGMIDAAYYVEYDGGNEWAVLRSGERTEVAAERIAHARSIGLLDASLLPVAIR